MYLAKIPSLFLLSVTDWANLFGDNAFAVWSGIIIGVVSVILITVITVVFTKRKKALAKRRAQEEEARLRAEAEAQKAEEERLAASAEEERLAQEQAAAETGNTDGPVPEDLPYIPGATVKVNGKTLNQRFAELYGKDLGRGRFRKGMIADYLVERFVHRVETNKRGDVTTFTKLPLADTHYVLAKNDNGVEVPQRRCFVHVYEVDGMVVLLINNTPEYANSLLLKHSYVHESSFPKVNNETWYSVVLDRSFSKKEVYQILDDTFFYIYGGELVEPASEEEQPESSWVDSIASTVVEEEAEDLNIEGEVPGERELMNLMRYQNGEGYQEESAITIRESLALASSVARQVDINKITIADHLDETFPGEVEVNRRNNYISSGILPLADTHYCLQKFIGSIRKTQHKCFIFVYETEGGVLLLLNSPKEYMAEIKRKHKMVNESLFPKSKDSWYSVVIDDTFDSNEVFEMIDTVKALNELETLKERLDYLASRSGRVAVAKPVAETKPEPEDEPMSIRESIELASSVEVEEEININKQTIADHLQETFQDIELNRRENTISSGILPLADTHYCLSKNVGGDIKQQHKCFIFVYETKGSTLLLLNSPKEYMQQLQKKHTLIHESLFPKAKDPWYSVVVDNSFSGKEVLEIIDTVKLLNEYPTRTEQVEFLRRKGIL